MGNVVNLCGVRSAVISHYQKCRRRTTQDDRDLYMVCDECMTQPSSASGSDIPLSAHSLCVFCDDRRINCTNSSLAAPAAAAVITTASP
jgi:hypothetical protein